MAPSLRRSLVLPLLAIGVLACQSASSSAPKKTYVLAFLVTGPKNASKSQEEKQTIMAGHMANIGRLADEGKLLIAGPFGKPVPDGSLRGLFVLDTPDLATAREWVATDPGVQSEVFDVELTRFHTPAPLRRGNEIYREQTAEIERSGRKPEMGELMRTYVLILSPDVGRVERAIAAADAQSKMIFGGEIDDSARGSYFGLVDAKDVDEALKIFGPRALRDRDYVGWYGARAYTGIAQGKR